MTGVYRDNKHKQHFKNLYGSGELRFEIRDHVG